MDEYLSCRRGRCTLEIERSVFIATAAPVRDEGEAAEFLAGLRREFPDATHHCYAYVCDETKNIFRFSDDGEPAKTAGMPILECLRRRGLFNVAVEVTRWFGGVKLGAGGLTRAYARAAAEAVDTAGVRRFERCQRFVLRLSYNDLPRAERYLLGRGLEAEKEFGAEVTLRFRERLGRAETTAAELRELTAGRGELSRSEDGFCCFE